LLIKFDLSQNVLRSRWKTVSEGAVRME